MANYYPSSHPNYQLLGPSEMQLGIMRPKPGPHTWLIPLPPADIQVVPGSNIKPLAGGAKIPPVGPTRLMQPWPSNIWRRGYRVLIRPNWWTVASEVIDLLWNVQEAAYTDPETYDLEPAADWLARMAALGANMGGNTLATKDAICVSAEGAWIVRGASSIYCGPLNYLDPTPAPGVTSNTGIFGYINRYFFHYYELTDGHADPYPYRYHHRHRYEVRFDDGVNVPAAQRPEIWPRVGWNTKRGMIPRPDPQLVPVPWALIPAYRPHAPGEVGPHPKEESWYKPEPVKKPDSQAAPYPWVSTVPGVKPSTPGATKPPKRTKETKKALTIAGTPVGIAFNLLTEGLDVLNCLYDALPRGKQLKPRWDPTRYNGRGGWRRPPPQAILQQVYQNVDSLDVGKLIGCLAQNQVEDFLIGQVGQLTKKANKKRGKLHGWAFGPAL